VKTRKTQRTRSGKYKVLLVDDHPVVIEGLAQRINRERDLVVSGEARSAREALRALAEVQPDVVVVDLSLPRGHGLQLIKDIKTLQPILPVLVFTMHDESIFAERSLRAGARGYVMKQEPPERLLAAIRTVIRGEFFVSEKTTSSFLQTFLQQPTGSQGKTIARLSDRELEIFELIGQGVGTREIAEQFGRSIKTVETHRARIMQKLSVKSAAELVVRASRWVDSRRDAQLGTPPPR
jgi:DNA-binding NarL/FixJ family response regulator